MILPSFTRKLYLQEQAVFYCFLFLFVLKQNLYGRIIIEIRTKNAKIAGYHNRIIWSIIKTSIIISVIHPWYYATNILENASHFHDRFLLKFLQSKS